MCAWFPILKFGKSMRFPVLILSTTYEVHYD